METEPSSDKGGGVKGTLSDERYCAYSLLMRKVHVHVEWYDKLLDICLIVFYMIDVP